MKTSELVRKLLETGANAEAVDYSPMSAICHRAAG